MEQVPGQMQTPRGLLGLPNQQQFYHGQSPMGIPRHQNPNNSPMYASHPGDPMAVQMLGPGPPSFIPQGQNPQFIPQHVPGQMQTSQGPLGLLNQQQFYHGQSPMGIPRHQNPNNPPMAVQMIGPGQPVFIPQVQNPQLIPQHVEYTQIPMGGPPQMEYRPQQSRQGQFPPVSDTSQPQRPYGYPQTTVYPMGHHAPPNYVIRTPTAPMTGMPQFQTQNNKTLARERKIIDIKDANSNKDVTQEILNCQPSWSSTGSTRGTSNNSYLDTSEQSAGSEEQASHLFIKVFEAAVCLGLSSMIEGSEMEQYSPQQATMKPIDTNRTVPLEIVVRGRLALEAYNKALAEGKTFDNRVPVMLVGQDRSGKTSLKKSLRGEPFNPHEESTVGIDVDPSHFRVSTEIWKAGEKDQEASSKTSISYEYHTARATVENLKQGKSVLKEKIPMGSTVLANGDFIAASPASYSSASDLSSTSGQDPSSLGASSMDAELGSHTSHIPKDIENEMLKRMQNNNKMEDAEGMYSVLWDFAGQLVYYATHPLFLTSRAIYFLVYDLSQNPSETAKPVKKQGVYRTFEDSFGMKTNLDYLDYWLFSIASLECQLENEHGPMGFNSEVLPEKLPPVFLVCTHADRPYNGGDPSTLAREVFGSLQTKPYNKHLHDVFVVDNTKSGLKSECPEVVRLRNEVLAVAKELPQMKEAIPIKWLKFEKELRAMSKEGHKWISLETATNIASERCNVVDSKEFQTLLNFLHDKRILIHFDDTPELNELVVLDPQWLIDVFKKVITVKPYDRQGKKFTELWCKLENKGILDEKLLEQVWGPLFDDRATCERLLQIMEKFSLLCPWPSSDSPCGKQYLVPSMLRTHPPEKIMKLVQVASRQIPPLFLKFKSGQVPPGLFPRLVLLFLQCGKQICLRQERTKLFHNFARFFTSEEENWSVILLCLSSSIKVVVHREKPLHESEVESLLSKMPLSADASHDTSDMTFPCEVHRQLGKILESMGKEFYWLKYMRYEASFICPVCCQGGAVGYCNTHHVQDCKHEECLHFWSHSQLCNAESIISCTKTVAAVSSRVEIDQFTPWFAPLGDQPTADHDGDNLASVEGPVGKRKRESPDSICVKHPKRTHAVKEDSPENDDLERLANQIINDWRTLGRRLLESDEALLDAIDKENDKWSEKAFKMLLKWKAAKGSDATFRVLHDALCHEFVSRRDLAEEFCLVTDD